MSESEDILSQPSDFNQLIDDLTCLNLNVHSAKNHKEVKTSHQMKMLNTSKDPIIGVEQQTIMGSSTCLLCREWRKLE